MSADPDELTRETGLEARYHVRKINDPAGKHDGCRFFVLDPQHDPLARRALEAYAMAAKAEGLDQLADELFAWAFSEDISAQQRVAREALDRAFNRAGES